MMDDDSRLFANDFKCAVCRKVRVSELLVGDIIQRRHFEFPVCHRLNTMNLISDMQYRPC
jgi:hypothetical protein